MDDKLYTQALKFLAKRPRSEKEVRENLLKTSNKQKAFRNASEEVLREIEIIIQTLRQQKFLNDEEFAKWWIEQRQLLHPVGWRVLEFELRQKGITKEIIEDLRLKVPFYAKASWNTSEGKQDAREELEYNMALELGQKRVKRLQGASRNEIYRKLGGFLSRRGFDLDTIKAVIDQLLEK